MPGSQALKEHTISFTLTNRSQTVFNPLLSFLLLPVGRWLWILLHTIIDCEYQLITPGSTATWLANYDCAVLYFNPLSLTSWDLEDATQLTAPSLYLTRFKPSGPLECFVEVDANGFLISSLQHLVQRLPCDCLKRQWRDSITGHSGESLNGESKYLTLPSSQWVA